MGSNSDYICTLRPLTCQSYIQWVGRIGDLAWKFYVSAQLLKSYDWNSFIRYLWLRAFFTFSSDDFDVWILVVHIENIWRSFQIIFNYLGISHILFVKVFAHSQRLESDSQWPRSHWMAMKAARSLPTTFCFLHFNLFIAIIV